MTLTELLKDLQPIHDLFNRTNHGTPVTVTMANGLEPKLSLTYNDSGEPVLTIHAV